MLDTHPHRTNAPVSSVFKPTTPLRPTWTWRIGHHTTIQPAYFASISYQINGLGQEHFNPTRNTAPGTPFNAIETGKSRIQNPILSTSNICCYLLSRGVRLLRLSRSDGQDTKFVCAYVSAWVMFDGTSYAHLHIRGTPWTGKEYDQEIKKYLVQAGSCNILLGISVASSAGFLDRRVSKGVYLYFYFSVHLISRI